MAQILEAKPLPVLQDTDVDVAIELCVTCASALKQCITVFGAFTLDAPMTALGAWVM